MLVESPDDLRLEEWLLSLPCRVRLPAEYHHDRVESAPPVHNEMRRFARLLCRGRRFRGALEYRQTLPALPRPAQWHGIYTLDVARGGLGFLHSEPLYPRERMRVILPGGVRHFVEIVRCVRMNEHCYSTGARFVDASEPDESGS